LTTSLEILVTDRQTDRQTYAVDYITPDFGGGNKELKQLLGFC